MAKNYKKENQILLNETLHYGENKLIKQIIDNNDKKKKVAQIKKRKIKTRKWRRFQRSTFFNHCCTGK